MSKSAREIVQKCNELTSLIQSVKTADIGKVQELALKFGAHIVRVGRSLVLLSESHAYIEAHVVCRLMFEHIFNLGALLTDERHFDRLLAHSRGEPGRQLKKIAESHETDPVLTSENSQLAQAKLDDPERKNDPKTGLHWDQIASAGNTDCFYPAYKQYSFLYAHSTFASVVKEVSQPEIDQLHTNAWTVLELACLLLKAKGDYGCE